MEPFPSEAPAQRRPGRGLMLTGAVLIVIAIVLGLISGGVVMWGFAGLDWEQFALAESTVPGTLDFEAPEPGNYFLTVPGVDADAELTVELRSRDTGEEVALNPWQFYGETINDYDDPEMVPFRLDEAGEYTLDVRGEVDERDAVVGRIPVELVGRMAWAGISALCGGGITVLLLVVGVILLVIGLVKNSG